MSISPQVVVSCFTVLMLLGIFVIVYGLVRVVRSGKDSSALEIPLFGTKKILIRGPAWLLLIVLGSLMASSPLLAAFAQGSSDLTAPPITVQTVQENERLQEENASSFVFVSDLSILDLRGSQVEPWFKTFQNILHLNESQNAKPAVLRNVMILRRVQATPNLILHYSTSGKLSIRCLSQTATYQEKQGMENGRATDTWSANIDVSTIAMNTDFEVIVEATYYDAFSTPENSYYSTYANRQQQSEQLSVLLLPPVDKPLKTIHVEEFPPNGAPGQPFSGIEQAYRDPEGRSYYWTTDNTRSNYYYSLLWTW